MALTLTVTESKQSDSNTMVTAKLEIATGATHSEETIALIVFDFFPDDIELVDFKYLFGGYSGSNYMVKLKDDSTYVLKITNGYSANHAELMCRTTSYLETNGYKGCCFPIPKHETKKRKSQNDNNDNDNEKYKFVSLKEPNQVPAFLLTFATGNQADKVMRENPNLASTVMKSIGGGLARMHTAASSSGVGINETKATELGLRWYKTSGGCCDVQDHIDGKILEKIESSSSERKDSFLEFYKPELQLLLNEMSLATEGKLLHGITHGDPFADNVLVDEQTGLLSAFIDIEDVCAGPLLFDMACCAIGCCFQQASPSSLGEESASSSKHPQVINFQLFQALMEGYCADRKLPELEIDHLVPFMRVALLCNCSWRFVKFNVAPNNEDFPEEAKTSYLELQHRIEYLSDTAVVSRINDQLKP